MTNANNDKGYEFLQVNRASKIYINSETEYERAQALLDDLLDVYSNQRVLIEVLSRSIQKWEDGSQLIRLH